MSGSVARRGSQSLGDAACAAQGRVHLGKKTLVRELVEAVGARLLNDPGDDRHSSVSVADRTTQRSEREGSRSRWSVTGAPFCYLSTAKCPRCHHGPAPRAADDPARIRRDANID